MKILVHDSKSGAAFWAIHEEWPGILLDCPEAQIIAEDSLGFDHFAMKAGAMRPAEFRGQLAFLSNFHPCQVLINHVPFASSEHAYQSFKMAFPQDAEDVRHAPTARKAKDLATHIIQKDAYARRPDWEDIKLGIMLKVLRCKFAMPQLGPLLIATGNRYLVEHNTWRDRYWGVYNGEGENHLGKLLMQVREELRGSKPSV